MNIYKRLLHVDWRLKDNRKLLKTAKDETKITRLKKLIEKDEAIQRNCIAQINNNQPEVKQ